MGGFIRRMVELAVHHAAAGALAVGEAHVEAEVAHLGHLLEELVLVAVEDDADLEAAVLGALEGVDEREVREGEVGDQDLGSGGVDSRGDDVRRAVAEDEPRARHQPEGTGAGGDGGGGENN